MSRSQFTLAVALVVVAATLTFFQLFPDDPGEQEAAGNSPSHPSAQVSSPTKSRLSPSSKRRTPRPTAESSFFDIGFTKTTLASLTAEQRRQALGFAAQAESDARATLAELTEKYDLTRQQQRDLFPIVAAHTASYHPSMAVNGVSVVPAPASSSLDERIHDNLDDRQQAALTDEMIDDIKWWQEIASQLEEDLDTAIDTGQVTTTEPTEPTAPVSVDTTPAEGHGEAASHSGSNIFDLLNQGN